jgi:NADP-dependent 3-hydroxy acid dehydrogenase YdfG
MAHNNTLQDAVFVILGATGGMGSALATHLSKQGAKLVLGARNTEKLSAFSKFRLENCLFKKAK